MSRVFRIRGFYCIYVTVLLNPFHMQTYFASFAADVFCKHYVKNKLINLADMSAGGWLTVSEYKQNDLASDDEGSKRIKSAEKAAASIMKQRQEKKEDDKKSSESNRFCLILSQILVTLLNAKVFFVAQSTLF